MEYPFGGASGCDGGIDASTVALVLVMPLQGELSMVLGWPSTPGGGSGGGQLGWREHGPNSTEVDVTIQMNQLIPAGVIGPQPPVSLEIRWIDQPDGGSVAWLAPSGVCSITFASNVCDPTDVGLFPNQMAYAISGTGTCSQAAAPEPGNSAAPLTIGDFYFVTSIVTVARDS